MRLRQHGHRALRSKKRLDPIQLQMDTPRALLNAVKPTRRAQVLLAWATAITSIG
jgi:hypothetical protein